MFVNKSVQISGRRNRISSVLKRKRRGGTIANLITAVIFFGLIGAGVLWVIRTAGTETKEYTTGMVNTRNEAIVIKCQSNLRAIWQVIQAYGLSNDNLPASFDDLVEVTGMTQVFQCPEPNSPKYEYIPGQTLDSPGSNVLLYEPEPVHNGKGNVLRVNGTIELLTPEELQAAIEQTKAHLQR